MTEKSNRGRPMSQRTIKALNGHSPTVVADIAGISPATVHNWISGKNGGGRLSEPLILQAIQELNSKIENNHEETAEHTEIEA